jgi:Tfp pilus assembly protein FimT
MRRRKTAHGVTTIELIIAMSIIVIMAGMGMPYFFSTLAQRRLPAAAMRVADDLRLTQAKAVTQSVTHCLHLGSDPAAGKPGQYELERMIGTTPTGIGAWILLNTDYKGTLLQGGVDAASIAIPRVCFNSTGNVVNPIPRPPAASLAITFPLTLTVANTAGTTKTITILSSGTVRVQQ